MDEETMAALNTELAALCQKFNVNICSNADAVCRIGLESWVEVTRVVKRAGQHAIEETLFRCEEINELGIFEN